MFVMANLSLVPQLRQLVDVLVSAPRIHVGDKLPISIRKPFLYSQTIVIFPEDGYTIFTSTELGRILHLAEAFGCDTLFTINGDVPVIEITCYHLNES